ncbi:MAG: ethyl tert-butyl ether degradation protein EthD [Gemmatimonadetes bacterium]|nr:MAG: ethyl tert-butyl ether degradation protein EthD [Gemmatimonadota bacterium]
MAGAKLVVLYPSPRDVKAFERAYTQDHAPMVTPQTFKGIKRFVASKVVGTPDGSAPPFYRIAELHFPSMEVLQAAAASAPAQKAVAHAVSISTGGKPVFLVAEEEAKTF